jgi:hypothetical protein
MILEAITAMTIYSASWSFKALCRPWDMVYSWTIHGPSGEGGWHIDPWEPGPIVLRGVELAVTRGPSPQWLMAGNGIVSDAMLFLADEKHGISRELYMPMMAKDAPREPSNYLDLHGKCHEWNSFAPLTVFYTVFYTKDAQ